LSGSHHPLRAFAGLASRGAKVSDSESERRRLMSELERLLGCLQTLPPSQPGYEKFPYMRAMGYWKDIASAIKDAAEWSTLAGKPDPFPSKPWLQLQLSGDSRAARGWPIDDLVRDLRFVQKLLAAAPGNLHSSATGISVKRQPTRRGPRYEAIDKELIAISAALPKSHEEVFRSLEGRIKIPNAEPFKSAGGWVSGFQQNPSKARSWLSKVWSRLNLAPFPRGPK
jgi:hypothetical protein